MLLKNLGKRKDIVVCSPDKGRGVVIINKQDYVQKMTTIISDCSKFCKLTHFDAFLTTLRLEDKVNRFLSKIKKLGIISDQIYKDLYSTGTSPGTLYGLPKIHKAGLPMRPILAAYNTAVYKLSKFLVPMIDGFTRNEFSLKNSYDFYSALQNFQHSGNVFLVSFDVCSLHTNVPVNEVIDILCDKIFSNCTNLNGFGRTEFLELLRLIFDNTLFFFNNCLYKRTDGLAMGNPLVPAMANIFLCNLEKEIFKSCPPNCRPLLYRRYLDDTFAVFSDEGEAIKFFNHINNILT